MTERNPYTLIVEPVSEEDGGGYMASFPDLPGCMSDGETPEEAVANALAAYDSWMEVQEERGAYIPHPNEAKMEGISQVLGGVSASIETLEAKLEDLEGRIGRLEHAAEVEASISRTWHGRRAFSRAGSVKFTQAQRALAG